jgi:hypothetical protein
MAKLCLIDATGAANFRRLKAQMRTRSPAESQLVFIVFDLLHKNGVDLRRLPLFARKRNSDGFAGNLRLASCARLRPSPMARSYSRTAISSVSKGWSRSALRPAM